MDMWSCILLLVSVLNIGGALSDSTYLIGLGSYDITGPAADVNMMGYANAEQIASGVHFRLKARTFVVAEPGGNRVVFVNLDACMASQLLIPILANSELCLLSGRYGNMYNEKNVAISGIHTHGGPGGYLQYVVYIITSLGFVRQSFDAIVDGIEQSIIEAHENLRPGSIFVNNGNEFVDEKWGAVGSFNWFATHGTSMSRTNSLISGDNKGAAARFMEDWAEQEGLPKGSDSRYHGAVVTGLRHSRLYQRVSIIIPQPHENGVYPDEFESTRIIGDRQFVKAVELFDTASEPVKGKVDYRQTYLDFSKLEVTLPDGDQKVVKTCPAAVGFAFAAGTTDGPGMFDFKQGDDKVPFNTSSTNNPNRPGGHPLCPWSLLQWLEGVSEMRCEQYLPVMAVVNLVGASALYGPHTLSGYIQEFKKLASALVNGKSFGSDLQPPDLLDKQISLLPPVVMDATPAGVKFGDTSADVPENSAFRPGDMVTATFWSACPRNDLLTKGTFSLVEFLDSSSTWLAAYDDDDFSLRFKWSRPSKLSPYSHATLEWRIPETVVAGVYRLRHFGASKSLLEEISHFTGTSRAFVVL
ncbi:hypothetical protein BHM03_00047622 [Ensete ventricosum]|nr:hypothetical protein BHM03_00047622 [Ensete ventricosum]